MTEGMHGELVRVSRVRGGIVTIVRQWEGKLEIENHLIAAHNERRRDVEACPLPVLEAAHDDYHQFQEWNHGHSR